MAVWLSAGVAVARLGAQEDWFEQVTHSLHVQSANGFFRSDLSGLFDLEGYYVDQRPPGLIFGDNQDFLNPRLTLFLDTRLGEHFYSLVEARVDRGFDPREKVRDARLDEYLLRYTPFTTGWMNLQAGKFPTAFGDWVPRRYSWDNPFINAPLPYENVTIVGDQAAPPSPAAFLARRNLALRKEAWLPMIWGPSYASGASLFGTVDRWDYTLEVKNAPLSARPDQWDGTERTWEAPTVTGRLAYRPNAAWNIGSSVSSGAYLQPAAASTLPAGTGIGDFRELDVGEDVSFAWHRWQLWAEAIATRFDVPRVGNADTLGYYLEAKYEFGPRLFGALRWNQQFYGTVADGLGGQAPWGRDLWRTDAAVGYRLTRYLQTKVQYSYLRENGPLQQGEQLVAAQVTLKF